MTAVATYDDLLVSQPETKTIWMSRRSELQLVLVARQPKVAAATGQKTGETLGEMVRFEDGVFRCPPTGTVTLADGRQADAAEITAKLETHKLKGDMEEGFWRVDPTAPPLSRAEMETLTQAAIALDSEKLLALIAQEEAGWGREDVLSIARDAVESIEAVKAKALEEAQREADAAQKGKPKA
jgi:hypothetical protein